MMRAEIISVGDELLAGVVVNSNASYIGKKLTELGYEVRWISTVGDDEIELTDALKRAYDRASLVVLTGGLGPTPDDITKRVVSKFFDSEIVFRKDVLTKVEEHFRKMGRKMAPINRDLAEVPEKAELIENEIGSAMGFVFTKEDRNFFVLPGVPSEMRRMMEKSVHPRFSNRGEERVLQSVVLRTAGILESDLYQKIRDFPERFSNVRISFLPRFSGVDIRLMVSGLSVEECAGELRKSEEVIREKVGKFVYGKGDTPMESTVADLLLGKALTVSVAESCTGGLVSHKLTNVPGSSSYFDRGVVVYSNEAKIEILGVPEDTIQDHGAVSPETAVAMAQGVRRISGTDIGLSTTGIAGPGGGTPSKPVGLVYIGYSDEERSLAEKHQFMRERMWNKERSAIAALDILRRILLGYE